MFLLSCNCFGEGIFSDAPPSAEAYPYVAISGNCIVDGIHGLDYEMDDADLSDLSNVEDVFCVGDPIVDYLMYTTDYLNNYAYEPVYGDSSILCANFENSLEAGSLISGIAVPINKYIVRRKVSGESLNPTLVELAYDRDLHTYVDYTAKNHVDYIYGVYPLYENLTTRLEGTGIFSEEVNMDFWGWILSDTSATPVSSYLFDMQIESDEINVVTDFKKYETYNTYPTFRWGNRMYKEGGLKTIPYNFITATGAYEVTVALMEELKAFINNKNIKVLRTPSGEILYVCTYDFSYKYMDQVADQPYEIKFAFTEVSAG